MAAVLLALGIVAFLLLRACARAPADVVERAGRALVDLAAAFQQGRVTTEFISFATSVQGSQRLQFGTIKQMEIFTRTDEATTAFGYVPLPDVVVEARAPVEYTYFLDLNGKWDFVLEDGVLHVHAPAIQFNQPAVDISATKLEIRQGSVFRDTKAAQENLRQSITSLARLKARENIHLVRETGRRQTTEFVENWLMRTFADGKRYPVKVHFPDDKKRDTNRSSPALP
jgi:hypothetical protein